MAAFAGGVLVGVLLTIAAAVWLAPTAICRLADWLARCAERAL